eukprot:IDg22524t1
MEDHQDYVSRFDFWSLGALIIGRAKGAYSKTELRRFRSVFGVTSYACSLLWAILCPSVPNSSPVHLLWPLMFLKVYGTEHVHAVLAHADEKTFRKWSWFYIRQMAQLKL